MLERRLPWTIVHHFWLETEMLQKKKEKDTIRRNSHLKGSRMVQISAS